MSLGQGRFIEMRLKREILQEKANKRKKETDEEILLRDPEIFREKNNLQFFFDSQKNKKTQFKDEEDLLKQHVKETWTSDRLNTKLLGV